MIRRLFIFSAVLFSSINFISAQITFQKTFERTGTGDVGQFVQQTNDGGFIIIGTSSGSGAGYNDICFIKTDGYADTLWTKIYGGIYYEAAGSVQQTTDGGYIIIGSTSSFGGSNGRVYLIKTDANGNLLWSKTFGGTNYIYAGNSGKQTADGGYIIVGFTQSAIGGTQDIYLVKTDTAGGLLWSKTFGGTGDDEGFSVEQTTDSGYVIAGSTTSFGAGSSDVYFIKADSNGNLLWSRTFGDTGSDEGNVAQQTSDGGYIILGGLCCSLGGNDTYLIKTNANGDSLWTKVISVQPSGGAKYLQQTTDGGYILTGDYNDISNLVDALLLKTDTNGNLLWTRTFGKINSTEMANMVHQTTDGGYIIVSSTNSGIPKIYLIKTDSLGNSGCNQSSSFALVTNHATQVTNPPTIITSHATTVTTPATIVGSGGIITTLCISIGLNEITKNNFISISPNPSSGNFIISFERAIMKGNIEILNTLGGKNFATNISNESKKEINLKNIARGIYFVKVFDGEKYYCMKIIIEP